MHRWLKEISILQEGVQKAQKLPRDRLALNYLEANVGLGSTLHLRALLCKLASSLRRRCCKAWR